MPSQKPIDLGKGLGLYDTASVRDKVRKWHTTGGGVLQQTVEIAGESDKEGQSKKSPRSSASASSHSKSKSESNVSKPVIPGAFDKDSEDNETGSEEQADTAAGDSEKRANRLGQDTNGPKKDIVQPKIVERVPANVLDEDLKAASAPKKRVVSDGHWRRKHINPNAPKPPPPPKPPKVEKPQYGWVRPPALPRPSDEQVPVLPPPQVAKPKPEPRQPIRVYAAKPRTKSFGDSFLSKRPEDSVPIRPRSPVAPPTPVATKLVKPRTPRTRKSSEATSSEQARSGRASDQRGISRRHDDSYSSSDDFEKHRTLSKAKIQERPARETRGPSRRRSLSVDDAQRRGNRQASPQRGSPRHDETEESIQQLKRRRRGRRSTDNVEAEQSPASLQEAKQKLNNYDDEAAKRRSSFRDEFKQFTPAKERRSSGRHRTTRRMSYSPDGIERLPARPPAERIVEPPPQRQTSARIQSWLTETPDPFEDAPSSKSRRDFSFERPQRAAMTESTVDTESTITDTTIEPRPTTQKGYADRRSRRESNTPYDRRARASSEPSDYLHPEIEVEYSSTTSVPILKRSGARHGSKSSSTMDHVPSRGTKPARTVSSYTESEITVSSVVSSSIDPRGFDKPGEEQQYNVARRLFPSTGKRLSTIVSVETMHTKAQHAPPLVSKDLGTAQDSTPLADLNAFEKLTTADKLADLPNLSESSVVSRTRSRASVKKRTATHADLMAALSIPASRSKSIVSARSIRTHKSRLETATVEDLMKELTADEAKYMRELRTLADGVIPILLKCVLSKSEAAVAAGLFRGSSNNEKEAIAEASKVIHELSVSIQRLKSLHTRIPKENHFSLLIWAQSAHSVYEKYIKTWQLGFQDVVVNLAAEGEGSTVSAPSRSGVQGGAWDQGLPRNEDGYVVDAEGERVDVAFLLKRPFVRLKFLNKTLKGINIKKPSEQAGVLANKFEKLMESARNKVDDEKARLEDGAAAAIDATRARDPKSLAPLAGVRIDAARRVRARDYFDLHLPHSTGQVVDNRVELLIRDDAPGRGNGGDILFCEINDAGRFLFFPPIEFSRISARAGSEPGELVVQIRGWSSGKEEWDEVFSLTTDDEEVRFEWIQWIGLSPVPPPLDNSGSKKESVASIRLSSSHGSSSMLSGSARTESTIPTKSRTPSPRAIDIPIGERAKTGAKQWSRHVSLPRVDGSQASSLSSYSAGSGQRDVRRDKDLYADNASFSTVSSSYLTESYIESDLGPAPRETNVERTTPKTLNEAMALAGTAAEAGSPTIQKRAARYRGRKGDSLDSRPTTSAQFEPQNTTSTPLKKGKSIKKTPAPGGFSVWIPNSEVGSDSESDGEDYDEDKSFVSSYLSDKPRNHHRTASVPSIHLASVPEHPKRNQEEFMSGALQPELPPTPLKAVRASSDTPSSAPSKLERKPVDPYSKSMPTSPVAEQPPPPPPHRTPSSNQVKFAPTPQFSPTVQGKRRSSSPLKHEYRPSSPSTGSSYSEDDSASSYSDESLTSDDELDDEEVASTFVSSAVDSTLSSVVTPNGTFTAPGTIYSHPNGTIKPSESASQAPYRTVPKVVTTESIPVKCVASIFTWSNRGSWELLNVDDCSIIITPGLISAYLMSACHEAQSLPEERPLVAQELTPLVPLRRGTALDITIRSPLTAASKLKPETNIIMFRSRSSEECEVLYNAINRSRINNPTYIALQNARPQTQEGWAAAMDRQNRQRDGSSSGGSSWWGFGQGVSRSRSYRASSRAQSTAGNTESSVGAMSSVLGAMKRFSGSNFMDKARSRMGTSKDGTDSLDSSGGSGARSPPMYVPGQTAAGAGISNAKVRLYVMLPNRSWSDLGHVQLSILPKEDGAVIAAPIMLHTGLEKRLKLTKWRSRMSAGGDPATLLDVTLPEPCFERWARTGIGVSVWVDVLTGVAGIDGNVPSTGGVSEKRVVKYMIQMKSERQCAYTFSLLGKLRY